jgi:hypothetical protein
VKVASAAAVYGHPSCTACSAPAASKSQGVSEGLAVDVLDVILCKPLLSRLKICEVPPDNTHGCHSAGAGEHGNVHANSMRPCLNHSPLYAQPKLWTHARQTTRTRSAHQIHHVCTLRVKAAS